MSSTMTTAEVQGLRARGPVPDGERRPSRAPSGRTLGLLAVALLAVVAVVIRVATESVPPLRVRRILPASLVAPGPAPRLQWPSEGQAAVDVPGVGSLGGSGVPTAVPIASVAKVMTAYLTLVAYPLSGAQQGFVLTVSAADVAAERERAETGQSVLPVAVGERITERQALEALLLPSANNVAELLAAHDAGSIPAFVARMNGVARQLGMTATTYTDPSGYAETTMSTARDQVRLAEVALRLPVFAQIVDLRVARLPLVGTVSNYDGLAGRDGYIGIKTGSDRNAGGCLVFAKRLAVDGHPVTIVGAVLGQRQGSLIPSALTSARLLGDSAAAAVRRVVVLPARSDVLLASGVNGANATAVTRVPLTAIGWPGLRVTARLRERPPAETIRTGQTLGVVSVGGVGPSGSRVLAARPLGGASLGWRLRHVF